MDAAVTAPKPGLSRWGAFAFVVGSMVGGGIFLTPAHVAQATGTGGLYFAMWGVGAALALAGALCLAELGAMLPKVGGEYVYLHEAYGEFPAFLYGWLSLLGSFSGAIAALALGASGTLVDIVGAWFGPSQVGKDVEAVVVAIALVWSLTGLACLQIQVAARLQLAITGTLMGLLLCGAVAAIVREDATAAPIAPPLPQVLPVPQVVPILGAFAGIFFAYSGWNGATYVAGEIERPQRDLPWALLWGTTAVAVLYLALNAAFVVLLPDLAQVGGHGVVGQLGVRHPRLGEAVQVVAALCMVGAALASTVTGARISFAMAQDGLFFRGIGALHNQWGTPVRALVLQAAWTTALIVLGESVGQLLSVSAVAMMLLSAGTVAAVITLRRRSPQAGRPFRTPLYPLTPLLYLLAMALVLVATAVADAKLFLGGILALALGWVGYFVHRRQRG